MSPWALVTVPKRGPRTVSPHRGRKVRKKAWKKQNQLRGFGRPRSITKSDWALARAWCGPGACLVRAWPGWAGAGLARAWCGPGAGLARAWCGPGNPGLGAELQLQSCCGRRIASLNPVATAGLPRRTTSSSGLEPFLPEHSLVMAGPAVELPGLRHVVYAQDKGQERSEWKARSCPPPCASSLAAAWEDVHIWPVGAPGGAERVDSPVRSDIARSHCAVAAADAARCSAPVAAAV